MQDILEDFKFYLCVINASLKKERVKGVPHAGHGSAVLLVCALVNVASDLVHGRLDLGELRKMCLVAHLTHLRLGD